MKFGGTSVESAGAIRRLAGIVRERENRGPVVVASAMGKTTNKLLAIAENAVRNDPDYLCSLDDLKRYHEQEGLQLVKGDRRKELIHALDSHFKELAQLLQGLAILGELSARSIDAISSYGERLSSFVVALALQEEGLAARHFDSRDFVRTDSRHTQAQPDFKETYRRLGEARSTFERGVAVMGGFIASNESGVTTTLGRGGSDYSAAIIGAGLQAEEIQIWTDVDGMMTTDPRLVSAARRLEEISFEEAAELAYFGAKVLHPATVRPAIERGIPVVILNSRRPEVEGTRIVARAKPSKRAVKAIACKRNITLVNVHSARMLMAYGFLKRVFEVFERWETPVDVVATSEVSVSLTIDEPRALKSIRADLSEIAEVSAEGSLALISVVGDAIGERAGIAARVFRALESVNVRMISQGASKRNLSVVVSDTDLEGAVRALHAELFERSAPAG